MSASTDEALAAAERAFKAYDALFRAGLLGECHAFVLGALRASLGAWGAPETALAALEAARYAEPERLRAALALTEATMPADFEWVWAEAERLYRFSRNRLAPERTRRLRRIGYGALCAVVVLLGIVSALRLWGRWRVSASGTLSTDYAAENAIDGRDATEWLAPEGQPAWLEIRLPRPRHVRRVRVLNGHNRFFVDRGAGKFRVTLFSGERALKSGQGRFERITDAIARADVDVEAEDVTMVRLDVLTFLGKGAAIGEVELD